MGTCCSLPKATPIKIKSCFTRSDLELISHGDIDEFGSSRQRCSLQSTPMYKPDLTFEVTLTMGSTYHDFLCELSNQLTKYITFHPFVLNQDLRYIRYETAYGLQVYKLPLNKSSVADITFIQLFNQMPFVDWSTGYALIVWFDYKLFSTTLDFALEQRNVSDVYNLLGIKHDDKIINNLNILNPNQQLLGYEPVMQYVYTPGAGNGNNYVQIQKSGNDICDELLPSNEGMSDHDELIIMNKMKMNKSQINHDGKYAFPVVENDIVGLLAMDNKLITEYLIDKHFNFHCDLSLDINALLACVEQSFNISKNSLIERNLSFIFKLSPFHVIQWHADRFNEGICYLLARNGLFNIRKEDKNIVKVKELQRSFINAENVQGINRGKKERRKVLIGLWRFIVGFAVIDLIEEFECGDWEVFDNAVQGKM